MKQIILTLLSACALLTTGAQTRDLPGPTPNLQLVPAGSYVIAMDNTHQKSITGYFNLKAYGLVAYLLNNNVRIKWAIKAGKLKDAADISGVLADRVLPSFIQQNNPKDFKAGPFIISSTENDMAAVSNLIHSFYSEMGAYPKKGKDTDDKDGDKPIVEEPVDVTTDYRPQVYSLRTSVTVDIRYDLTGFKPKGAVLNNGGNERIHLNYFMDCSIPTINYGVASASMLLGSCYTFASEPHNSSIPDEAMKRLRAFIASGGNFLAQCAAIRTYENNPHGRFQTTTGIKDVNASIGTNLVYPNADLSFSQFEGAFNASDGGSLKNWKVVSNTSNNAHVHAGGTGSNSTTIGASVSKLKGKDDRGGLVFYVGNHSFKSNKEVAEINGIRMYMNAFLTPSLNLSCPANSPLAARLLTFEGSKTNSTIALKWRIAENELAEKFEIERSENGTVFTALAKIGGSQKSGEEQYSFTDNDTKGGKGLYRIKLTDKTGRSAYSKVLVFDSKGSTAPLKVINNPVNDKLVLSYYAAATKEIEVVIYNTTGRNVYQKKMQCPQGENVWTLPVTAFSMKGYYIVEVSDQNGRSTTKFLKN